MQVADDYAAWISDNEYPSSRLDLDAIKRVQSNDVVKEFYDMLLSISHSLKVVPSGRPRNLADAVVNYMSGNSSVFPILESLDPEF